MNMSACRLCPRACGVDRAAGELGFCGQGSEIRVARAALHFFEEPPISGTRGSGTVFFEGCSLRCVFCQNHQISRSQGVGRILSVEELADTFLSLQKKGAHNINLVTPTHFSSQIALALEACRDRLFIPVVYNSSGYESVEALRRLDGLVDVYLPDFKYVSSELSARYSSAPDYFEVATDALREMFRQVGPIRFAVDEESGCELLQKGVVVRHLVLPGCRRDSMAVLSHLATLLPKESFLISLMSQYTPDFADEDADKALHRRLTRFEYESVTSHAQSLGLVGFMQERSASDACYTPDFHVFSDGE